MRPVLFLALAFPLAACSGASRGGRQAEAAPEPTPRVFQQEYVASPSAHFETLAAERRAEEAAAKAAAKAKTGALAGKAAPAAFPPPAAPAGFPPAAPAPSGFPPPSSPR